MVMVLYCATWVRQELMTPSNRGRYSAKHLGRCRYQCGHKDRQLRKRESKLINSQVSKSLRKRLEVNTTYDHTEIEVVVLVVVPNAL